MLISDQAWRALIDAGINLRQIHFDTVELWQTADAPDVKPRRAKVISRHRSVGPAEVRRLARDNSRDVTHVLLAAPRVNEEARRALDELGWSWVATPINGGEVEGVLVFPGNDVVRIGSDRSRERQSPMATTGRVPWGMYALIRLLLAGVSGSQVWLAERAHLSQPRVSQLLKALQSEGFVGRFVESPPRWSVSDWDGLLQRWLDTYPGPGGVTTYWFGLDPLPAQLASALRALETALPPYSLGPLISGDMAADEIAHKRRPRRAIIYSLVGADLTRAGLTPSGPEEATLELVVPEDWSLWLSPSSEFSPLAPDARFSLADPVQVIWDLMRSPGSDRDQAAAAVTKSLRNHLRIERAR